MIIRKLIQTRPNTGVEFYSPTDEEFTALNGYMQRDIEIVTSEDSLTKTITIALTEADHLTLSDNDFFNQAKDDREKYCDSNSITYSIEETVE
jgi:hypothetical protein|tara:strand:- start:412 stop:690 length:279 start_codon:yes stop_codon:yes gene_type:complete